MGDKELDNIEMARTSRVVDGQGVEIVSRLHISTLGDEQFDDRKASTFRGCVQGRISRHPSSRVHISTLGDEQFDDRQASTLRRYVQGCISRRPGRRRSIRDLPRDRD